MLVVIELAAEHFKRKAETACFIADFIYQPDFTATYFIAVVQVACKDVPMKGKPLIVALQNGAKLRVFYIILEVHPHRVVRIVEEHGLRRNALLYWHFFVRAF